MGKYVDKGIVGINAYVTYISISYLGALQIPSLEAIALNGVPEYVNINAYVTYISLTYRQWSPNVRKHFAQLNMWIKQSRYKRLCYLH